MTPNSTPWVSAPGRSPFNFLRVLLLLAGLWRVQLCSAEIASPGLLNYQGRVQVGTRDFEGIGQFKFALVSVDSAVTYWSNDGTPSGQPAGGVALTVVKGLYNVRLGDTTLPNMTAIPPAALARADLLLRVWFNDGLNGFQQFVPDQRILPPPFALTAGTLAGPLQDELLPPSVVRLTNGIATVTGDVVVRGKITATEIKSGLETGESGLPTGTRFDVLINGELAPEVRFEGLHIRPNEAELILTRVTSDNTWPFIFMNSSAGDTATNPPIALRMTLPDGALVTWMIAGGRFSLDSSYVVSRFERGIGSDAKPYDYLILNIRPVAITRTNVNVIAMGKPPSFPTGGRHSGQPSNASLRLTLNGVNFNNVTFSGIIQPGLVDSTSLVLNPTMHTGLSAWALGEEPRARSAEVTLVNGVKGNLSIAKPLSGANTALVEPVEYELRPVADGLFVEVIHLQANR